MTYKCLCLFLCFASFFALNAQDTELWTSAEARYKLNKELRVDFTNGLRLNQNISEFKSDLMELGLRYRIVKGLTVRGAYRYVINPANRKNRQRLSAALFYKKKVSEITFALRSKYQYDFRYSLDQGSSLIRNKLSAKYSNKQFPLSPVVFGEVFHPIREISIINEWRLGAGLEYAIDSSKSIGLKYFFNSRQSGDAQSERGVIGLGFEWNLN